MSKTAWVAILLLLATNTAWFLSGRSSQETTDVEIPGDALEMEQTISELQAEIARLKRAEPVLIGSTPDAASTDASESESTDAETAEPARVAKAESEKDVAAQKAAQIDAEKMKRYQAALEKAKAMLRKVMQVEDPGLRAEGLRELTEALQGDDAELIEYSLSTLHSLRKIKFDRSAFQAIVAHHLKSENGGIRRAALYALHAVDPEAADPSVALKSASDPEAVVRQHSARLISLYGGPNIEGEAAEAITKLLADENRNVRRGTLRGLSNTRVTPEIEQRLIEMAAQPEDRRETVQFGLSQLQNKSRDVVDALFKHLEDENHHVRLSAHRGLQRGVAKENEYYVASQYAERLGKIATPTAHKEVLQLIARYGDDRLAPQLEQFADNELVDAKIREMARKAADYLIKKKPAR